MTPISLSKQTPLAKGGERAIYQDPTNSERLVKILLSQAEQNRGGLTRSFFTRFAGDKHRMHLMKQEQSEYARIMLQNMAGGVQIPMAHLYGFVETDLGVGLVTQRVFGPETDLAPTWNALAREKLIKDREIEALTAFCRQMLELGVRSSDLTASNIAVGHRSTFGEAGPYEVVLIDGYGDTHVVPIRTWSVAANRKALMKRFNRLGAKAGYTWDVDTLSFKK